jgi:hypothetical protein
MSSGCNVCNSRIQKLSLLCLSFSFQLGLWSMISILDLRKSSNECTGKSVFFVRSLLCPFILLLNGSNIEPCDIVCSYETKMYMAKMDLFTANVDANTFC